MKQHCVDHTLLFFLISNSVTTSSNLSNLFSAGLINKKKKYKQADDRHFVCITLFFIKF